MVNLTLASGAPSGTTDGKRSKILKKIRLKLKKTPTYQDKLLQASIMLSGTLA